ncbi:MAG TPA: tetratricopeptide repeat protein, partial [Myxococcota bacterium]|nr:tetratricopeptide repeat protein [Myxococcota bacterium]
GKALMETGQATAAVEQLDRAHALWPNNAEYLRWRGHARRESGDVAGAVADWRLALELVPGDAWTLEQLRSLETARAPVASTPAPVQPATAQGARPLPGLSRLGAKPTS